MPLQIEVDFSGEENSSVGMLKILSQKPKKRLTHGMEVSKGHNERFREGPYVDPQPLACWLAREWWKLNWEPDCPERSEEDNEEWNWSHSMLAVGDGWLWPHITIHSDGVWIHLNSYPSPDDYEAPFRFLGATGTVLVLRTDFEKSVDRFVDEVLGHPPCDDPDLPVLWEELSRERRDRELSQLRRMEALLGLDPEILKEDRVHDLYSKLSYLGERASEEVALDMGFSRKRSIPKIREVSKSKGFDLDLNDSFDLDLSDESVYRGHLSSRLPWEIGYDLAERVRTEVGLNGSMVADAELAGLLGTSSDTLSGGRTTGSFSWVFSEGSISKVALQTREKVHRRFAMARLLGDRLLHSDEGESLLPATRSYSYRQKVQRAFAAEFLAPRSEVGNELARDCSSEKRDEVARRFGVASSVIDRQLQNLPSTAYWTT